MSRGFCFLLKAEGKAEGLAEGERRSKLNLIQAMYQQGFNTAMIAKITGMSVSEIDLILISNP